jgi:ATP-dependent phosphofructokinase / diphosphate-dependent phosphofructokinase
MTQTIGILTAGSDVPGLNAAIRAFGKAATSSYGMDLIGFQDGFEGLIEDRCMPIQSSDLSNILSAGGTFLGTSRRGPSVSQHPDDEVELLQSALDTYHRHNLDGLVCIGGRETLSTALRLSHQDINIITLPKAIDNHLPLTDLSIGYGTALEIAAEAIDRLHSTAHSHHRIIIVELMGAEAGWLTLAAGLAGGADVILLPEIPYDIQKVANAVLERKRAGKRFSIIAVAESARTLESVQFFQNARRVNENLRSGEDRDQIANRLTQIEEHATGSTMLLANRLEQLTSLDTRVTILGYLLRGGSPSASDRVLAAQLGAACADLVARGVFGVMVAARGENTQTVPLVDVANRVKQVPLDHPWIEASRRVGTCFGD